MKKLILQTSNYIDHERRFKRWLKVIGMGETAIYYMPLHVREMLQHMELKGIVTIYQISNKMLVNYVKYLHERKNHRRAGGLSIGSINKHIQAIRKFSKYLWLNHKISLDMQINKLEDTYTYKIDILNEAEIESMYEAAENDPILNLRDQAILDIFYGCGLRRREGVMLDLDDVDLKLRRIHVRYGKNYTQRYVPFTRSTAARFKGYVEKGRMPLLEGKTNKAFFISMKSSRLSGMSIIARIKKLQQRSNVRSIRAKQIGVHSLRHSIATHLLHRGLPLKQIAKFLGHRSIESTQIYTKLAHEL